MIPKTLSATSIQAYEECPMRWKVEYLNRTPSPGNTAASLGSACHEALDEFVSEGFYTNDHTPDQKKDALIAYYDQWYHTLFADNERYEEGKELLLKWLKRNLDWSNFEVLSTEQKLNFVIQTTAGPIKFNYIMDRKDRLGGGDIRVVDYKTVAMPFGPESLKHKVQARSYALAAQIEHPDADRIWVVFDLLRHDEVGIVFTKAENRVTRDYLRAVAQRIVDDDDPQEVLGEGCRWCVRRDKCDALQKHVKGGGHLAYTDIDSAAKRLYEVKAAASALKGHADTLEAALIGLMKQEDVLEVMSGDLEIKAAVSGRRAIDAERVLAIVGPTVMNRWGNITVGQVDKMLKTDPEITDDQKSKVKQSFRKNYGDAKIKITKLTDFEGDSQ